MKQHRNVSRRAQGRGGTAAEVWIETKRGLVEVASGKVVDAEIGREVAAGLF